MEGLRLVESNGMFDEALDAGKAGIVGDENQRAGGIVVEHEIPAGAFQADAIVLLQLPEDMFAERVTGAILDVNLRFQAVAGTTGDGLVARQSVADIQPHMLPGQKLQRLTARRLQGQLHDILGQAFQTVHPGLDSLPGNLARAADLVRLDHAIAARGVATAQKTAIGLL